MEKLFKTIGKEDFYGEVNFFLNGKKSFDLLTNDSDFSEKLFDLMSKAKKDICFEQKENGDKAFKHTKTKVEFIFRFRNHYLTEEKFYRLVMRKIYNKPCYH